MKVIKNAAGDVINIGDWDYQIEQYIDNEDGNIKEKITNPMPSGAYEDTADVSVGADGGLYVSTV